VLTAFDFDSLRTHTHTDRLTQKQAIAVKAAKAKCAKKSFRCMRHICTPLWHYLYYRRFFLSFQLIFEFFKKNITYYDNITKKTLQALFCMLF